MREDREPNAESSLATRRAALGLTAAMTAGLLAEKAISPDSAHAEGVSSVNGKTGAVELPGLTSEGDLPSTVVISSTEPLTISGAPSAGEVLTATGSTAADWQMGGLPVFNTANYASIQEAIEKAEGAGGGTVYVPVGTQPHTLLAAGLGQIRNTASM